MVNTGQKMTGLMARVRTQLRRTHPAAAGALLSFDDIQLDPERHRVSRAGNELKVGLTEYRLLTTLPEKPGRVFIRDRLLDHVWGRDNFVDTRTVDVHIVRLRIALTREGGSEPIRTVGGAGYALGYDASPPQYA
ncbi:Transcriptional regulatory protein, C terminal [Sulfitobacter dubius]|nr:Transcriptional regulatory protein, C terminal [Sulfitobacter dubius]